MRTPGMRTPGLLAAGLFVVLAAVTACQSGTSAGAGTQPSVGPTLSTSAVAPTPPTSLALPPIKVTPTTPGSTPPSIHPPTMLPVPAQPRTPVPAGQINTSRMVNPPSNVEVSSDGKYVVFTAEQSGCQLITAQATSQTTTEVTILVTTTSTRKGTQMCPMIVRQVYVVVQLAAPLGGRMIVFQAVTAH